MELKYVSVEKENLNILLNIYCVFTFETSNVNTLRTNSTILRPERASTSFPTMLHPEAARKLVVYWQYGHRARLGFGDNFDLTAQTGGDSEIKPTSASGVYGADAFEWRDSWHVPGTVIVSRGSVQSAKPVMSFFKRKGEEEAQTADLQR